jgi:membrane peptidoglycan carboxypeptidase
VCFLPKFSRIITALFLSLTGIAAYSALLYVQAPVTSLRGKVSYTPHHAKAPRDAGLASRHYIPIENYPADMLIPLYIVEDMGFFEHPGISVKDMRIAVEDFLFHGKPLRGASTITQQLVKNVFLKPERSFYRKYKEIIYALKLERHFSKGEILAMYASVVEIAPGVYGLQEGAQFYFGKTLKQLDAPEAAFLATVIRAPSSSLSALRRCTNTAQLEKRLWSSLVKSAREKYYLIAKYQHSDTSQSASDFMVQFLTHVLPSGKTGAVLTLEQIQPSQQEWQSIRQEATQQAGNMISRLCATKFK